MTKPPGTTVQALDLDDLDQIVGGVARGRSTEAASRHDHDARAESFLASVHDAATVVATVVAADHAADHVADPAAHETPSSLAAEGIGDAHALAADAPSGGRDLHAHAPIDDLPGDPLAHHGVIASLGAEAIHDLVVARHRVATLGAHTEMLGDGFQGDHDGAASASSAWREGFERILDHATDYWAPEAPAALTIEALQWETRFLHDGATLVDTIAATEPTFAARTAAVLAETRHVMAAILSISGRGSDP